MSIKSQLCSTNSIWISNGNEMRVKVGKINWKTKGLQGLTVGNLRIMVKDAR